VAAEVLYSLRAPYPPTLIRGRDNRLRAELVHEGAIVTPSPIGTFQLLGSGGTVLHSAAPAAAVDGALEITVPAASLPATQALGELYQLRWRGNMPDNPTLERLWKQPAVLSQFRLAPPIADADLVQGNYPDLVDQLGSFNTSLQDYIDQAWGWVLRKLLKVGRWPDLLFSTEDLVEVARERAWFLVFRFLFRRTSGESTRFERLMDDHGKQAEIEWNSLSARWGDDDGLPTDLDREAASGVVHPNAAPRRRLRRSSRW